jgi:hypothetical protein
VVDTDSDVPRATLLEKMKAVPGEEREGGEGEEKWVVKYR